VLRIFCIRALFWFFRSRFFKKRAGLANILASIYSYLLINHLTSCILILLGLNGDVSRNWMSRIPAPFFNWPNIKPTILPREWEIYVSASYWSYVTTSHLGVGDITAVTPEEKVYATIVICLGAFIYAFLFGNLASLVEDAIPAFQKRFESNYRYVLQLIKSNFPQYEEKIHVRYFKSKLIH